MNVERSCGRLVAIRGRQCPQPHLRPFLEGFYRAASDIGLQLISVPENRAFSGIGSVFSRLGLSRTVPGCGRLGLCPVAWASDRDVFPLQFRYRLVPWIYDCWGPQLDQWRRLLRRLDPPVVFFSSRDAMRFLSSAIPGSSCHWVPEAVDASVYDSGGPLIDRPIAVLEIGRTWPGFSERFGSSLASAGVCHIRPTAPGSVGIVDLPSTLKQARIVVCYPKSITHPELAGGVETVTHRYFEAMASRCILVGHCPDELRDLWGYNPVVEVGSHTEPAILMQIALDPAGHQDLVDRNYRMLQECGLWKHRIRCMVEHCEH